MNFPQILKISSQDMRKIFPSQYYKKYANHQKVREQEQQIIKQDSKQKRNRRQVQSKWEVRKQMIPQIPQKYDYNPRYESYQSTISLNKEEVQRLNKFTRALSIKLKITPQKKPNLIRSPIKYTEEVQDSLLYKLKAIEDLQYERILKERTKRKEVLDKKSICKFVRKIKSTQVSPQKNSENPQNVENSKQLQFPIVQSLNNSRIRSKAHFCNLNLVTNFQTQELRQPQQRYRFDSGSLETIDVLNRRDLLKQTKKIKDEVKSMQTLSYYQNLLMRKKRKQLLSMM